MTVDSVPPIEHVAPAPVPPPPLIAIVGGVVYSLGATTYALRLPKLSPSVFGFHEFFPILVIIAAILHFIVLYNLV